MRILRAISGSWLWKPSADRYHGQVFPEAVLKNQAPVPDDAQFDTVQFVQNPNWPALRAVLSWLYVLPPNPI